MRTARRFALLLALALLARPAGAAPPELTVAISPDIPPYVMEGATRGLEVDIVRAALPDYALRFVQMPYQQLQTAVPEKRADASFGVQEFSDEDGVFYSRDVVTFANAAFSKKAAGLEITRVADLGKYEVLAWQDADRELGPEFARLFASGSPQRERYVEIADQREQVRRFWQAKDAVIVIDRSVFAHESAEMGHRMDEVVAHDLFPAVTDFKVAFADAGVRDRFDRGLARICGSGEYRTLLERYRVELPRTVCH